MLEDLKPCPFCGSGETEITENKYWTGKSHEILSYNFQHCCNPSGQIYSFVQIKGKLKEQVVDSWNARK